MKEKIIALLTAKFAGTRKETLAQIARMMAMQATTEEEAIKAHLNRTAKTFYNENRDGLNISDRVWNLAKNSKKEMEIIIQNGIKEGKSADEIQRGIKDYLNEPEKLFRRVRNADTGEFEWSEAAKKYHPGQGIYRSAYKNAMRLARTEITAAYRDAEWESYQNNPLIIGYEIRLSNNHTTLKKGRPVPLKDICDTLAGVYPKSFKWTGWHPQCRCYIMPIQIHKDELQERIKMRNEGRLDEWKPKNVVTKPPKAFENWVRQNADKIKRAEKMGGMSRFLKDNSILINSVLNGTSNAVLQTGVLFDTKAPKPSKTEQQKADIQNRWDERLQKLNPSFTLEQIKNHKIAAKILNITQGKEMTFEEANALLGNINFSRGRSFKVNCQCCVVANELRRQGFNVTAMANTERKGTIPMKLAYKTEDAWRDANGNVPKKQNVGGKVFDNTLLKKRYKTISEISYDLNNVTKEIGRYHIDFVWDIGGGHIITLERQQNGDILFYDPQSGLRETWYNGLSKNINLKKPISVLRVDNLLINTKIINSIVYVLH